MGFGKIFSNKLELYSLWRMRLRWAELLAVVERATKSQPRFCVHASERLRQAKLFTAAARQLRPSFEYFFLHLLPLLLRFTVGFFPSSLHEHISAVRRWSDEIRSVTVGFRSRSYRAVLLLFALNGIECWMNLLPRTFNAKLSCELCFPHTRDSIVDARTQSSLLLVGVSRYLTAVLPFPNCVSLSLVCRCFFTMCAPNTQHSPSGGREQPRKKMESRNSHWSHNFMGN